MLGSPWREHQALHGESPGGLWQIQLRLIIAARSQQLVEPLVAGPCIDPPAPTTDDHLNRRQGPRQDQGGCHDHAGGDLLFDREIGAECHHRDL